MNTFYYAPSTRSLRRYGGAIRGGNEEPTTLENFRFELRTPSAANRPSADIYLKVPRSRLTDRIELEQLENSWTRIAAGDVGRLGDRHRPIDQW